MRAGAVALLLLSMLAPLLAPASPAGWLDQEGRLLPDRPDQKSVDGFGAWIMVTPDSDWQQKWDTPADTTPSFTTTDKVSYGQSVTILLFYVNPRSDAAGAIRLSCDMKVTRPDGSLSIDEKAVDCASGPMQGSPENVRLSNLVVKFVGEPGDLPGRWLIEVTVRDEYAKVSVPLTTSFVLSKEAG